MKARDIIKANPDHQQNCHVNGLICKAVSLIERLEPLILETKAGHDGLYDERLKISKQLLSMIFYNKEQLDNFLFIYGKWVKLSILPFVKLLRRWAKLLLHP